LVLSDHVQEQIGERGITEVELRRMLEHARRYRRSRHAGVFLVPGRLWGQSWEFVIQPEPTQRRAVVVTAYLVRAEK
jgi:hypothetical protein